MKSERINSMELEYCPIGDDCEQCPLGLSPAECQGILEEELE
jgi:hypothetical protein